MATTTKRVRRVKAAASPAPAGPTCGHSGCGPSCNVRYCGPTSPMHNHHILSAARGVSHVWSAAIVAGLAVVLTGAIAFSAVQAETQDPTTLMLLALRRIEMRLDRMEPQVKYLYTQANPSPELMHPTSTTMQSTSTEMMRPEGTTHEAPKAPPAPPTLPSMQPENSPSGTMMQ